jgi:hypothetical protein
LVAEPTKEAQLSKEEKLAAKKAEKYAKKEVLRDAKKQQNE